MTIEAAIHVLHLARWYPHSDDAMFGLFIQNQIRALPVSVASTVIFTWPKKGLKTIERHVKTYDKITEIHISYPTSSLSLLNFLKLLKLTFKEALAVQKQQPIDLIHVHILTRMAIVAALLSGRLKIPYIVSEHWSRYFPANPIFKGYFRMSQTIKTVRASQGLICVSDAVREAMERFGIRHPNTSIIPNVVDVEKFKPAVVKSEATALQLMHISCFEDKSKNISGLLHAAALLAKAGVDFNVQLVGEGPDLELLKGLAFSLGLHERHVVFVGLLTPDELSTRLPQVDYLVQSSHYETFSTVVAEAWACGVPVVSTMVGLFADQYDGRCGIAIENSSPEAIAAALQEAALRKGTFSKSHLYNIAASQFSREVVGASIFSFYHKVLKA